MPGHPAADLAALDLLFRQRKIFSGDYTAGILFATFFRHREDAPFRGAYLAAIEALDRSGGRSAVEALLAGQVPRAAARIDQTQNGLDALHTHFTAAGFL